MDKIVIYGCGKLGQYVFQQIRDGNTRNIQLSAWIDNYANDQFSDGIPIYREKQFIEMDEYRNALVLIAIMDREEAQRKAVILHGEGRRVGLFHSQMFDAKLPVLDECGELSSFVYEYGELNPVLPYMEFQVADQCNLRCKACMHFSNIVEEPAFASIDEYEECLIQLRKKFSTILRIRLMGGEPLLNKNLFKFVEVTRNIFPNSDIRIVTNGLLITRMENVVIETIKKNSVVIEITQYPKTREMLKEIITYLDKNNLVYFLSAPAEFFYKRMSDGTENPEIVFVKACLSKTCTFLRNKRLFICPHIPMLFEQQDYFKFEISDEEYLDNSINIFDDSISGWDILERFEKYFTMCRFCSSMPQSTEWSCGKPERNDWFS